jgi:hypothetical protein
MTRRSTLCFVVIGLVTFACGGESDESAEVPPAQEKSARGSVQPETSDAAETSRRPDNGSRLRGDISNVSGPASALGARVTATEERC